MHTEADMPKDKTKQRHGENVIYKLRKSLKLPEAGTEAWDKLTPQASSITDLVDLDDEALDSEVMLK